MVCCSEVTGLIFQRAKPKISSGEGTLIQREGQVKKVISELPDKTCEKVLKSLVKFQLYRFETPQLLRGRLKNNLPDIPLPPKLLHKFFSCRADIRCSSKTASRLLRRVKILYMHPLMQKRFYKARHTKAYYLCGSCIK